MLAYADDERTQLRTPRSSGYVSFIRKGEMGVLWGGEESKTYADVC
jgi:hypothetical protein